LSGPPARPADAHPAAEREKSPEIRMARKLVPLDEAAKTLGVTPDELNTMRENRQIYGYRDGATWKFKPEDIDRLAQELAETTDQPSDSSSSAIPVDILTDADSDGDSDDEIVLLSEVELGSGPSTSSTVIGSPGKGQSPEDSDIKLSLGSGIEMIGSGGGSSTIIPKPGAALGSGDSSVRLTVGGLDEDESDVLPVDFSDQIDLSGEGSDKTKKKKPGSDVPLVTQENAGEGIESGSDLTLVPDDIKLLDSGSDLMVVTEISGPPSDGGSDLTLGAAEDGDVFSLEGTKKKGSSVKLGEDVNVLDSHGLGTGSDITISPGDSGINLIDPSDSGLSLEEPLELSSADDESSFDLSSSDSGDSSSGTLGDSSEFDSDAVMELQGEDDFLLTPLEEAGDDESQDSGSQVIALDSDTDFDDAAPTMAGSGPGGGAALLEADDDITDLGGGFGQPIDTGTATALAPSLGMAPGTMMVPAHEAPYTVLNILALSGCVLFLALTGMMTFDLMRNMWSWEQPFTSNSMIMDWVLGIFGA
jgi:hypothetical protein